MKVKPLNFYEFFRAQLRWPIFAAILATITIFTLSSLVFNYFERSNQIKQIISIAGESTFEALNIGDWDIALKQIRSITDVGDTFDVEVILNGKDRVVGPLGQPKFGFGKICKIVDYSSEIRISGCKWFISRGDLVTILSLLLFVISGGFACVGIIKNRFTMSLNAISTGIEELIHLEADHASVEGSAEIIDLKEMSLIQARIGVLLKGIAENAQFAAIAKTTQTIAHDLKTPINAIQSALDSEDWEDFSKQRVNFNSAMMRLRSMVDSFRRADLESVVKSHWGEIQWQRIVGEMGLIAKKAGATVLLNAPHDGPIYVDVPKVERVIMNLIKNAMEAGAKNVWVSTEITGIDLAIEISDDGPGVSEEFVPKLFGRGNTHNKQEGTGLGLNFVKETANGHGGEATYERVGGRSIFRATLPGAVKSEEKNVEKKEAEEEGMRQELQQLTHKNEEPLVISGKSEKFSKVTLRLSNRDLEVKIIAAVNEKFPTIEIGNTLDNSAFLWASDHQTIKEAVVRKVPIQIVSAADSLEKITETICNKLKYFI